MNYYLLQVRIAVLVSLTLLNSQHLLQTFICQVSVQLASSKSSLEDALLHKNVHSIYVITHAKNEFRFFIICLLNKTTIPALWLPITLELTKVECLLN